MKRESFHAILFHDAHMLEDALQFAEEFVGFEFMLVIRIGSGAPARFGVVAFVGRRDDEQAGMRQHASALVQERTIIREMLDDFEGDDEIETVSRERHRRAGRNGEAKAGKAVIRAGERDGVV